MPKRKVRIWTGWHNRMEVPEEAKTLLAVVRVWRGRDLRAVREVSIITVIVVVFLMIWCHPTHSGPLHKETREGQLSVLTQPSKPYHTQ